ncbi:MAG: hypothetical protein ACOC1P_04315 [Minisyncoccales bacterium]
MEKDSENYNSMKDFLSGDRGSPDPKRENYEMREAESIYWQTRNRKRNTKDFRDQVKEREQRKYNAAQSFLEAVAEIGVGRGSIEDKAKALMENRDYTGITNSNYYDESTPEQIERDYVTRIAEAIRLTKKG